MKKYFRYDILAALLVNMALLGIDIPGIGFAATTATVLLTLLPWQVLTPDAWLKGLGFTVSVTILSGLVDIVLVLAAASAREPYCPSAIAVALFAAAFLLTVCGATLLTKLATKFYFAQVQQSRPRR